jgi:hypothetical protein
MQSDVRVGEHDGQGAASTSAHSGTEEHAVRTYVAMGRAVTYARDTCVPKGPGMQPVETWSVWSNYWGRTGYSHIGREGLREIR